MEPKWLSLPEPPADTAPAAKRQPYFLFCFFVNVVAVWAPGLALVGLAKSPGEGLLGILIAPFMFALFCGVAGGPGAVVGGACVLAFPFMLYFATRWCQRSSKVMVVVPACLFLWFLTQALFFRNLLLELKSANF